MIRNIWDWCYGHPALLFIMAAVGAAFLIKHYKQKRSIGERELVEIAALSIAAIEGIAILKGAVSAPESVQATATFIGGGLLLLCAMRGLYALLFKQETGPVTPLIVPPPTPPAPESKPRDS